MPNSMISLCCLQIIPLAERLALGTTPDFVRLSVGPLSCAVNGWNSDSTSVAFGDSE
ncbi:hypothetical protein M422DRAFT_38638 [Sphaerobolus stellatus SS14]|uniref:Uncharacterized protein n=1 Tax=Sphaerobolus stellatus (strain SS14) TaxID=990650 RepID=A0A0C9TUN1_SPHS4|nr:hypothetical protein M422DRAFT_38638 [Sphaerobolus stellatus SS14]